MEVTNKTIGTVKRCREILRSVTPLKNDCGALCGGACCAGDDRTGMGLFPGEYELLKGCGEFGFFDSEGNFGYKTAVCGGSCDRENRPLACMIFPYYPVVDPVDMRADLRAAAICPLLTSREPQSGFIDAMLRVAELMSGDEALRDYAGSVNSEIDELYELYKKLAD